MFDGLDEFFAGDPEFLNMIEGKLAASTGAQVLICARSSLLTTSEDLRALIERQFGRGSANIEIYELAPWTRAQQRFLATLRFTGTAPAADGKPSPRSDAFIAELNRLPAASQLATNAYYADLLVEEFKSRNGSLSDDEFALLDHAVDGLIDREHGKLVFDWDVFMSEETFLRLETAIDGFDVAKFQNASERAKLEEALTRIGRGQLRELLQSIAHLARVEVARPSESGGLSVADLLALGEVYTDQTLDKALEQRVLLSIVQFAFFGPGRERGTIRFTHELLADYLAGCHAVHLILDSGVTPEAVGQAVGVREDFANTLVLRYLVQALEKNAALRTEVIAVAESAKIKKRNQRNARVLAAALAGELLPGRNAGR